MNRRLAQALLFLICAAMVFAAGFFLGARFVAKRMSRMVLVRLRNDQEDTSDGA